MAEPISLSLAKSHLRVDIDHDDTIIGLFIVAARENAQNYLNRPIPWMDDSSPPAPVPVPSAVVAAMLLDVGSMYENRESGVIGGTVSENYAWIRLLTPYRICMGI